MIEGTVVTIVAAALSALGYCFLKLFDGIDKQFNELRNSVAGLNRRVTHLEKNYVTVSDCIHRSGEIRRDALFSRYSVNNVDRD